MGLLDRHRFLEFLRFFIPFDRKMGKIAARYPQAFGIKALIKRICGFKAGGERQGGVLWHTTGSGKSFTTVFLCRALLLSDVLKNCRVMVVTDRVDLEKQLSRTFQSGGAFVGDIAGKKSGDALDKTKSGKDLARRIGKGNERIILTITPLLYEERKPLLDVNQKAVDAWFEKVTASLSDDQRCDLKRKHTK